MIHSVCGITEERAADVLGNLVASLARLGKLAELLVEHSFELHSNTEKHEISRDIYGGPKIVSHYRMSINYINRTEACQ